jgi:hypothetical protein
MSDLFDRFLDTREMAKAGMQAATDHADAEAPGWSRQAYEMFEQFAAENLEFMTEDVRVWAHKEGFPLPPDGRAWGSIAQRAVRERLVVRAGYRTTRVPPAHATPRPVWHSQIFAAAE